MADFANLVVGLDTSALKRGERDVKSFGKTSKAMNGAVVSATRALALFGGAFAAARAVSSASQAYANMANNMRVLGFEADDVAAKINQIGEISKRTRSPLDATAQLYQRISIAAKDLGASQQQVLQFTENVGFALAQQGGSAAQASGALLQLSQAMSAGTVRAEEFNSILEGALPIAQAAANGIEGAAGSVGQLRNMVIAGEVSSREFFNAILSSSEALEAAFGNTVPTVSQALTVLSTSFTLFVGQADSFLGASSALAEVIILLSGNLEFLAGVVSVAAVAFGVRYFAAIVTARVATFSLIGALQGLKSALISTGIGVVIVGLGLVVGQLIKARAQTESFGDTFRMVALQVKAASLNMKAYFISALGSMAYEFIEFTYVVADGINSLFGTNLMGASAEITQNLNKAFLETEAAAYAATAAANALKITIAETSDESDGTAAALDELAAGAVAAASSVEELTPALTDAEKATQSYADTMQGFIVDGIGKAVDNMVDGFTGGLKSIKDIFVATIKQMIAFAIKNKILLSLGLGGSAMGTAALAATGGLGALGGSLSSIGSLGSVFAGSLSGTAGAFMSGGIGAGVGQIGATLGAVTGSIPSFSGGGFTGNGARSGGLDGQGGFLALNHPKETIIDHTRSQSPSQAPVINITVNGARGNAEIVEMVGIGVSAGIQQNNKRIATAQGRPT
jgi:tape measure domain-containing protein